MPFDRPSLVDLINRIQADYEAKLSGVDAKLRFGFVTITSRVFAGAIHLLYGALTVIVRALFVDTSWGEWLTRWGTIFGVSRKPATKATGGSSGTGTNGTVIPLGTVFVRGDSVEYVTTAAQTVVGGIVTVPLEAREGGIATNADIGSDLTLAQTIPGIDPLFEVDAPGLTGGFDEESDAELRARILQRLQNPPQGGSKTDYERWILEYPGATRAFVYPRQAGPGSVTIAAAMDNKLTYPDLIRGGNFDDYTLWVAGPGWSITANEAHSDGTQAAPSRLEQRLLTELVPGRQYTVSFHLTARTAGSVRVGFSTSGTWGTPRTATGIHTEVITAGAGDFFAGFEADADFVGSVDDIAVTDLTSPIIPSAEDMVAIQDYVVDHPDPVTGENVGAPVSTLVIPFVPHAMVQNFTVELRGVDTPEVRTAVTDELADLLVREGAPGATLLLSHINEAISVAPGEEDHVLISPAADVVYNQDDLPIMGTVTFV